MPASVEPTSTQLVHVGLNFDPVTENVGIVVSSGAYRIRPGPVWTAAEVMGLTATDQPSVFAVALFAGPLVLVSDSAGWWPSSAMTAAASLVPSPTTRASQPLAFTASASTRWPRA